MSFEYFRSSREVVSSINASAQIGLYPSSSTLWISGYEINNPTALYQPEYSNVPQSTNIEDISGWMYGYTGGVKSNLAPYEFLIYRWQASPLPVPDSTFDFQLNFTFPVDFADIEGVRTCFGVSCGRYSGNNMDLDSSYNMSGYYSELDLYSAAGSSPFWVSSDFVSKYQTYTNRVPRVAFPVTNPFEGVGIDPISDLTRLAPSLMGCYVDYHPEAPFTWSSANYEVRRAMGVICQEDGSQNPYSDNYGAFTPSYVYLFVMCPILWGQITPPEPEPETTPNYSRQLDDINGNVVEINTNLDAVLQKLDDIYNKMADLDPTLSPITTLPRYDFSASQSVLTTFSPSAFRQAVGGAQIVDNGLSDILGAAGLSYLLPLLAGLACVGWVLTKGRN